MSRYAVITPDNLVVNIIASMETPPFWTPPYQAYDAEGNPVGDPIPTTPVPDTDPPTAQIGYSYNPSDGTFMPVPEIVTQSTGLMSRILSALNPFK
jgi:hypothetical protein